VKVSLGVLVLGRLLSSAGIVGLVLSSVGGDSGTISQSETGSASDESRYARPKEAILVARMMKIGWK
jgi:hypothetical protein